jgi:hypothetical protein
MKPIRSVAVFAIAGIVSALGIAAAAAVPAVAQASIHASAGSAVRSAQANAQAADVTCPFRSNRFTTYYGGCGSWIKWSCAQGNTHSMNPPDYVSNDCAHDVLMYSNSNETGSTLCIAPFTRTKQLNGFWRSFIVRSGTSC